MSVVSRSPDNTGSASASFGTLLRNAFAEFMTIPVAIILGFLVLAAVTLTLDTVGLPGIRAGQTFLGKYLFSNSQGTSNLLGTLLSGLLTVISITFSVLLLAVQQTANSLTNQVYDQFLRRRSNQVYFGYFVGLTVYTLAILSTIAPNFNPIYSATAVVLLTIVGLCLLILLIYSTIDQMRPNVIVSSIHDHTLGARQRQRDLLRRTRRHSRSAAPVQAQVTTEHDGFLESIDLQRLASALAQAGPEVEVVVLNPIGTFIAFGDPLAQIRASSPAAADHLATEVKSSLRLVAERNLDTDPAWGVTQLETIGWTTTSSAKSTPQPPRLVIHALRDLLARWLAEEKKDSGSDAEVLAVVYPDNLFHQVLAALTTIAAGTNESLQHLVMTTALHAFRLLYDHLPTDLRRLLADALRRLKPALNTVALTRELENALSDLIQKLRADETAKVADELEELRVKRAKSLGLAPDQEQAEP